MVENPASAPDFVTSPELKEGIKPIHSKLRANRQNFNPTINAVKPKLPVREGSLAISLKRPEGVTNDTAFNFERQKIQPA